MAWARVQSALKLQTTSATTTVVTLGTTPITGNKIIVSISLSNGNTALGVSTVKDSNANSLTLVAGPATNTNNCRTWIYAYDVPATPSTAMTVTWSAAVVDSSVVAQEISGLLAGNTTAMVDGTTTPKVGSIVGTASAGSATYSSTAANEFLVSVFGDFGNSATMGTPSGTTLDTNSVNTNANADCVVAYKNSTGGAETVTWTPTSNSGTDQYAMLTIAFKLAASSGLTSNVSDSATTAETITVTPLLEALTVTDSTTTSDTVAVAIVSSTTLNVSVSDAAHTAETVTAAQAGPLLITSSDSVSTTESKTVNPPSSTPTVSVTDSTTTSEFIVVAFDPIIIFTLEVNVSDSVTTTESKTATMQDLSVTDSDSVATSESIGRLKTSFVNAADSTSITETVAVTLISSGTIAINVSDNVATTNTTTVSPLLIPGVSVNDNTATHESTTVQIVSGTVTGTHPPLGGVVNNQTNGGTPNNGSAGGSFTNPTAGGILVFTTRGGNINQPANSGDPVIPAKGGVVQIPEAGGDIE